MFHVEHPAPNSNSTPTCRIFSVACVIILGRESASSQTRVAEAALVRARVQDFDDPHSLVPEYIRPSYAEEPRRPTPR